jgi:hypothetical protein
MKQVAGFPNIVSESGWIAPSKYQTEGPFLTAAYGSLTGIDTLIWQSIGSSEWQNSADGKWHQGTPQTLGQFPAAALMFRNGYIKKARPWCMKSARWPTCGIAASHSLPKIKASTQPRLR